MHADPEEAQEYLEKSLAMAERIGEVLLRAMSLWALTATALCRHDVEVVRSLAPQARAKMAESLELAKDLHWL
jgi:ribosomal protein S12 methylthiotransferase accessory factor YcaO